MIYWVHTVLVGSIQLNFELPKFFKNRLQRLPKLIFELDYSIIFEKLINLTIQDKIVNIHILKKIDKFDK